MKVKPIFFQKKARMNVFSLRMGCGCGCLDEVEDIILS